MVKPCLLIELFSVVCVMYMKRSNRKGLLKNKSFCNRFFFCRGLYDYFADMKENVFCGLTKVSFLQHIYLGIRSLFPMQLSTFF